MSAGALPADIISSDFASFQQATPDQVSTAQKIKERDEKLRKKDAELLKPKQLEAADKLVQSMKEEDEKERKAVLLRKIHAYVKSFPDRLKGMNVTPAKGAKSSVEELEIMLSDIEHQLGKGGGVEMLSMLYGQGAVQLEQLNKVWNPLNLKLDGLSQVVNANMEERIKPLLEELTIKHENWFSTRVEVRLVVMTAELILVTHRINSGPARETLQKAQQQTANADLMKKAAELGAKK